MPSFTERSMWVLCIYIQGVGELGHRPRLGVHTKCAGVSPRNKILFFSYSYDMYLHFSSYKCCFSRFVD